MLFAVLIARDEAARIGPCLAALAPHVDAMLVLDTGSRDATAAIAEQAGALVHHMVWPDDFAKARNHALQLAEAAGALWHLVVDADEVLSEGGPALRGFCSGPPRLGRVWIESEDDSIAGHVQHSRACMTRVLPAGTRYQGRVHEQVVSDLPRIDLPVRFAHSGYRGAQRAAKQGRNRRLLEAELADHPHDPYLAFQLAREDEGDGDMARAAAAYRALFDRVDATAPWHHDLTIRMLHCLGQSGRRGEAMALVEALIQPFAHSPDFFFTMGNLCLDAALDDPARAAAQWLPAARAAWQRCLALGERPDLSGSVAGRGSWLAQHNLDALAAALPA